MEAGPELDRLVHKHLFNDALGPVPPYSTDPAAAWLVMQREFAAGECHCIVPDIDGQFIVHTSRWTNGGEYGPRIWDDTAFRPSYKAPTMPHAVCLAAMGFRLSDEDQERWEYDSLEDHLRYFDDSKET